MCLSTEGVLPLTGEGRLLKIAWSLDQKKSNLLRYNFISAIRVHVQGIQDILNDPAVLSEEHRCLPQNRTDYEKHIKAQTIKNGLWYLMEQGSSGVMAPEREVFVTY